MIAQSGETSTAEFSPDNMISRVVVVCTWYQLALVMTETLQIKKDLIRIANLSRKST